jgi:hypothetical protein
VIEALTAGIIVTGVGMCIVEELENTPESGGVPPKMRVCLLVPGAIAWDGCDCGQLAQTIQGIYPTQVFPTDASEVPIRGGCGPGGQLIVEVLVSLTRCVPGMTAGQPPRPPTCAQLRAAALEQQADAYAVRKAVNCCLADLQRDRRIVKYAVGRTNFVGPEGNCGGSELIYKFELM